MKLKTSDFKIAIKAMRLEELLKIATDGDDNSKVKIKVFNELDSRCITLNNVKTYR